MIRLYSAVALLVLSLGSTATAQEAKPYTTKDGTISFRIPAKWRLVPEVSQEEEKADMKEIRFFKDAGRTQVFGTWCEKRALDPKVAIEKAVKLASAVHVVVTKSFDGFSAGDGASKCRFAQFLTRDGLGLVQVIVRGGVTHYFSWRSWNPHPSTISTGAAIFESIRLNRKKLLPPHRLFGGIRK